MSETISSWVRGKIKLNNNRNISLHISKFLLYYSIFQCISYQPISVADLGWSVNHIITVITLCLQNECNCLISFWWRGEGAWGLQPPTLVRQWHRRTFQYNGSNSPSALQINNWFSKHKFIYTIQSLQTVFSAILAKKTRVVRSSTVINLLAPETFFKF